MTDRRDEQVRDPLGRLMFSTVATGNQTQVFDRLGHQLGFCEKGSTFQLTGQRVATSEQPGLLFQKGKGNSK